jgi:hypothetical protein
VFSLVVIQQLSHAAGDPQLVHSTCGNGMQQVYRVPDGQLRVAPVRGGLMCRHGDFGMRTACQVQVGGMSVWRVLLLQSGRGCGNAGTW